MSTTQANSGMSTLAHAKNYLAQQYRAAKRDKDWQRGVAVFRAYDLLDTIERVGYWQTVSKSATPNRLGGK